MDPAAPDLPLLSGLGENPSKWTESQSTESRIESRVIYVSTRWTVGVVSAVIESRCDWQCGCHKKKCHKKIVLIMLASVLAKNQTPYLGPCTHYRATSEPYIGTCL